MGRPSKEKQDKLDINLGDNVSSNVENSTTKENIELSPTTPIACRSIVQGELLFPATKSGNLYTWAGYGDVTEVEYQDLLALLLVRSRYLFEPFMLILNDIVLENTRFKPLKDLYENILSYEDISDILALPTDEFEDVISQMPRGMITAIQVEMATQIEDGKFDSIQKVKVFDKIFNTDLKALL